MPPAAPSSGLAVAGPLVIGVDLGGTKCHGLLAELDGTVLAQQVSATRPAEAHTDVLTCVSALTAEATTMGRTVATLVVGVPGVVEPSTGLVGGAPNLGWDGFALADLLAAEWGQGVVGVENDAQLAALAEARSGVAHGVRDFVLVAIGTGIGAAVVVDGRLVTGQHNAAGEVGAMVFDRAQLRESTGRGLGVFERSAGGPGIAARAANLLDGASQTASGSSLRDVEVTPQAVLDAWRRGDPVGRRTVDGLLDDLAMAFIALVAVLDPELIVLDGGVGRSLGPELDDLGARMARHVPPGFRLAVAATVPTSSAAGAVLAAAELARSGTVEPAPGTLLRSMALEAAQSLVPIPR